MTPDDVLHKLRNIRTITAAYLSLIDDNPHLIDTPELLATIRYVDVQMQTLIEEIEKNCDLLRE